MLGVVDGREVLFCSGDVGGGRMLIPVACLAGIAGISRDDMMMHVIHCKDNDSFPREAIRYLGDEYYVDSRWLLEFAVQPVFSAEAKEFALAAMRQHSTYMRLQAATAALLHEKDRYTYSINELVPSAKYRERILECIAETPGKLVAHSDLLRSCRISAAATAQIIEQLVIDQQIKVIHKGPKGKKYYQADS